MKKISIIFLLAVLFCNKIQAQDNWTIFAYEVNFPSVHKYLTKASWAGARLEFRHFITKEFSIGTGINWATYEQHLPKQTFVSEDGNRAVTSDFVAQTWALPLTANCHYYFYGTKMIKPFVGVALGGQYLEQSLYYNVYVSDDNNWGFVARPEAGVVFKNGDNLGFMLSCGYSYSTNKLDVLKIKSFQNFCINVGLVF